MHQIEAGRGDGKAAGDWYQVPLKTNPTHMAHSLMDEYLHTFLMCKVRKESHVPLDKYISLNMVENFVMTLELVTSSQRC